MEECTDIFCVIVAQLHLCRGDGEIWPQLLQSKAMGLACAKTIHPVVEFMICRKYVVVFTVRFEGSGL